MRTIESFDFGVVTLRNAFDPDSSMYGECYVVNAYDANDRFIGKIYGFTIEEIDGEILEEYLQ